MKKGQKVRVIANIAGHGFKIGEVVTWDGGYKFIDDYGEWWVMASNEYELIEDFQYGEEVEVSEGGGWYKRTFLCVSPCARYVVWCKNHPESWKQCRKVNTELEQLEKAYEELGQKINQLKQK